MKKLFLTLVIAFASVSVSMAQNIFVKGDGVAHFGLGLGTYLGGSGYSTVVPPILASAEFCITDALINRKGGYVGIGGYMAYAANKYTYHGNYGYNYSYFIIGARGAFHYQFVDNLDTYAGAMIGYNIVSSSYFGSNIYHNNVKADSGGLKYTSFIGARYYFTNNIAAFAELGYGIAALEFGVAIKF